MRKIVYSGVLKAVAMILFIASIVCGVMTVTDGITDYLNEKKDIYSFESDFSESWYISYFLDSPENTIYNAYWNTFCKYDDNGAPIDNGDKSEADKSNELEANIKQGFEELYNSDKINYYVKWNDVVLTNCGASSAEELMSGEYYTYLKRNVFGKVERVSSVERNMTKGFLIENIAKFDDISTIIISCNVKEDTIAEYKAIWEIQEEIVFNTFIKTLVCAVVALLLFIYLMCVCGKNKEGEYKNIWLDKIWLEVHLAAIAGLGIGAVALCAFVIDEYISGHFPHGLVYLVLGTVAAFGSFVVITSILSVVRNIKTHRFIKTSLILQILRWLISLTVKILKWIWRQTKACWIAIIRTLSKKTGIILITMLFIYTAVIGALGVFTAILSPICLFLGVLVFAFACFVVAYRAKDLDEIKKGAGEIRGGNAAYKIPELKCDDMKILAADINDIAVGLDESVAAKVKAERLKTELITNVSHDLKTPITSIISYTELLSSIDELPEEAKDYVAVIAKKGDRLRRLTQDLFDISKVQSGNEDVVSEKLDVALLINQALGEHDNEIQSSGLPFCVEAPKELYIYADGRKMSRVLSNLINNILKYTMKNTRVFITASEKDGTVEIEFKNISAYPLLFNSEEITGRFVRGDESRTAEGNGLGLAIAKSYTEVCKGTFEVKVDGDMFKAILKFNKYIS